MRSYGIRFSASDISEAYAQETLNRVNSFNKGYRESSPDFVENFANMLNAYPTMDKEIAAIGPYALLDVVSYIISVVDELV